MQELAPGVWVNTTYRASNPGFVATSEGIIVVDTPLIPEQAWEWRRFMEEVAPIAQIRYIINTDHHRGHALGNQWFQPAPVLAHERAWKEMRGYTENFKQRVRDSFKKDPRVQAQFAGLQIIPPTLTFTDRAEINLGGHFVRIIHLGGHTPATSIVWLPEERVAFVGDMVWVDQHPFMVQAHSKQWLNGLNLIRRLDADYIVPGHGPVCGREATDKVSEYIRHLRSRVRSCLRAGKTKQETANSLVSELSGWFPVPPERKSKIESQIKSGVNRVYNELLKSDDDDNV